MQESGRPAADNSVWATDESRARESQDALGMPAIFWSCFDRLETKTNRADHACLINSLRDGPSTYVDRDIAPFPGMCEFKWII